MDSYHIELNALLDAIDVVHRAAKIESQALEAAEDGPTGSAIARLRAAHLAELDAVQMLYARAELFRRRYPFTSESLTAV